MMKMAKEQTGLAVVLVLMLVYVGSFMAFRAQIAESRDLARKRHHEFSMTIDVPSWADRPANRIYRPLLWLDEKIANDGSRLTFEWEMPVPVSP